MKLAELILGFIIIIGMTMSLLLIPFSGPILVLSLGSLSVFYMAFSFFLFNNFSLKDAGKSNAFKSISYNKAVGTIGLGISISITLIGILFKIMSWPGVNINLGLGLLLMTVILLIAMIRYYKNNSPTYLIIFKRIGIIGGAAALLFLLPRYALLDLKYRNYPDYINAIKKRDADPRNKTLEDLVKKEREEMYRK